MNYNSTFLRKQGIHSVIGNGCDLQTAFSHVLNYFDPNKSKNRKTKILDCTHSHMFVESDMRLFSIDKTKNLSGTVRDKRFDIIMYEPPRNQTFYKDAQKSSKAFSKMIKKEGMVIVKMNDFKEKGNAELRGSFDIWDIFSDVGLYLHDNIIYNFRPTYNPHFEVFDRAEIVHMYFMAFRKKS